MWLSPRFPFLMRPLGALCMSKQFWRRRVGTQLTMVTAFGVYGAALGVNQAPQHPAWSEGTPHPSSAATSVQPLCCSSAPKIPRSNFPTLVRAVLELQDLAPPILTSLSGAFPGHFAFPCLQALTRGSCAHGIPCSEGKQGQAVSPSTQGAGE